MLFDQPIPHQLVMLLVLHTFAVRTRFHDYRNWIFRFWPVDIRADYKSVVHRNGTVSFDHHCFGWITRYHLFPLGTTTHRYNNRDGFVVSSASSKPVKSSSPLAIQMRRLSFCVSGTRRSPLRQGFFNREQCLRSSKPKRCAAGEM